jgi:drug/metabolite transporter (DMT)-like permease
MVDRLLVLLAAFLWSSSGFFAKSPVLLAIPLEDRSVCITFWRAVFASLMVVCFIRRWQWSWQMVPMAGCFAAMTWTFISAMVYTEAALAIWLQYLAPAWVVVFSWVAFREVPDRSSRPLLAMAAVGVSVILATQFMLLEHFSVWGITAGVLSGATFAGVVIFLRRLRGFDPLLLVFVNQSVTALVLAPVAVGGYWPQGWQWLYLAGFGVFQMGLPYLLFALALRRISSQEASGLGILEPVLVPVWVYLAWRDQPDYEPPAVGTIVGGLLILIGLVIQLTIQVRAHWSQAQVAK